MHNVNLDLLRAVATHHSDGTAKDPHAHHRAELLAEQRSASRQRWLDRIARLRERLSHRPTPAAQACSEHPF